MKQQTITKMYQTNLSRYGSTCPLKAPEVDAKRKETFKQNTKYCKFCGKPTNHPQKTVCEDCKWSTCPICGKRFYDSNKSWRPRQFCSEECKLKGRPLRIQRGLINKYGVNTPLKSKAIRAKMIVNCVCEKCGKTFKAPKGVSKFCDECKTIHCPICGKQFINEDIGWRPIKACNNKECQRKYQRLTTQSSLQKLYGVDSPVKIDGVKEKIQQTCLERYGTQSAIGSESVQAKIRQTNKERYGVDYPLQSKEKQKQASKTMLARYGVPNGFMTVANHEANGHVISHLNRDWQHKLKESLGIEFELEKIVGDYSYDLAYKNILIDINPWITHNSTMSYAFYTGRSAINVPIPEDYHLKRWLNAKQHGYLLLSYFDWYDESKFLDIVRAKLNLCRHRIFARKTTLHSITQKEANALLEENHLQGKTNNQTVCLGLFYNNELLQVMTFGKPRMSRKYTWELIRLCTKKDWIVVGGKSKLLKHFLNSYTGSVFSYDNNDISCEEGKLVKPMGIWRNIDTGRIINNNSVLRRGASRFIGDEDFIKYPKGMSNDKIMEAEGYVKIYNCGSTKQIIRNE